MDAPRLTPSVDNDTPLRRRRRVYDVAMLFASGAKHVKDGAIRLATEKTGERVAVAVSKILEAANSLYDRRLQVDITRSPRRLRTTASGPRKANE
jgi:hypothetical protein